MSLAGLRDVLDALSGLLARAERWTARRECSERSALRRLREVAARIECGLAGRDVVPGKR